MNKTLIAMAAVPLAAVLLSPSDAQTNGGKKATVNYPYGSECVVTLDPRAWPETTPPTNTSGFVSPATARGQLIYLSEDWCVLKDGSFENWIPREKVLMLRASK